jgi:hypothetical protein
MSDFDFPNGRVVFTRAVPHEPGGNAKHNAARQMI